MREHFVFQYLDEDEKSFINSTAVDQRRGSAGLQGL